MVQRLRLRSIASKFSRAILSPEKILLPSNLVNRTFIDSSPSYFQKLHRNYHRNRLTSHSLKYFIFLWNIDEFFVFVEPLFIRQKKVASSPGNRRIKHVLEGLLGGKKSAWNFMISYDKNVNKSSEAREYNVYERETDRSLTDYPFVRCCSPACPYTPLS